MDQVEKEALENGLRAMGITPADFHAVRQARSHEEAVAALAAVKDKVRKAYKKLAFELHPDRNPGDLEKEALFKVIGKIRTDVEALELRTVPLIPVLPMVPVVFIEFRNFGGAPRGPAPPGQQHKVGDVATTTVTQWPAGVSFHRGKR